MKLPMRKIKFKIPSEIKNILPSVFLKGNNYKESLVLEKTKEQDHKGVFRNWRFCGYAVASIGEMVEK